LALYKVLGSSKLGSLEVGFLEVGFLEVGSLEVGSSKINNWVGSINKARLLQELQHTPFARFVL